MKYFVTVVLFICTFPVFSQSTRQDTITSLAINRFITGLQQNPANYEKEFWEKQIAAGTPVIEEFKRDSLYKLVTFLWKDSASDTIKSIAVKIWSRVFFSDQRYLEKCRLQKIAGSHTWYKTFKFRRDALFSYQFLINDKMKAITGFRQDDWIETMSKLAPDPYNKQRFAAIDGESSVLELDTSENSKNYYRKKTGIAEGLITAVVLKSNFLQNERKIWFYTPPAYDRAKKYPLYLFLDGGEDGISGGMPVSTILNNLLTEKKITPGIGVFVGNSDGARTRDLFYNENFASFIASELLPVIKNKYRIGEDAGKNLIAGSSLGGNAALFVAIRHPEIFGGVISQSGGFMYGKSVQQAQDDPQLYMEDGFTENEWLTSYIATVKKNNLKVRMDVGLLEDVTWITSMPRFGYPTLLVANRHLRDVLLAKGYKVFYNEYNGGHESLSWQKYLSQGLIDLAGDTKN